jgi:potassium/hydrogen antiporter
MNMAIFIASALVMLSIVSSKISVRFGIPGLLLFLGIGMLAGSDGPGNIPFEDYRLTQFIGVVALAFILYSGGLSTQWKDTRPILRPSLSLATLGVIITTLIAGLTAVWLFQLSLLEGLLVGAIIASTDASAVFSILKERALGLKEPIKPLLEFESGTNDPMAVFLTVGFIELLQHPDLAWYTLLPDFFLEMLLGAVGGFLLGQAAAWLINHINLRFEGLYAVLSLALALGVYALVALLGGSGFLAVYIAAVVIGNKDIIHKRTILQFHDGLTWLTEIAMFLILGLLVFPSQLLAVAPKALALALVLMFVARPLSVFVSLFFSKVSIAQKTMVAWVGLRGAVPITLATFPLLAGLENAQLYFNLAFFVVISSILIQGSSLPWVAKLLKVDRPVELSSLLPLGYTPTGRNRNDLLEVTIPKDSWLVGERIIDARLPPDVLVVLLYRKDEYIIPKGATKLQAGDVMQILGSKPSLQHFTKHSLASTAPHFLKS